MMNDKNQEVKEFNEAEMEKISGGKRRFKLNGNDLTDEEKEKLKEFDKRVGESM